MVAGFMLTEMPRQCAINGHYKGVFSNEVLNCKVSGYASSPLLLPVFMPCCLPRCAKRASDRERERERIVHCCPDDQQVFVQTTDDVRQPRSIGSSS